MTWYYKGNKVKDSELENRIYEAMDDDGFERYMNLYDEINGNAGTELRRNDYSAFRTQLNDTIDSIAKEIRLMCPRFPGKNILGYGFVYVDDEGEE